MWHEFILLTMAHAIAVASPGADFAVVLKNTLKSGAKTGIMTAIGVGCGISIHLIYTLLGIAIILSQSPIIFTSIKLLGAIYLLWMAWHAFQARARSVSNVKVKPDAMSSRQAFIQGFITNVFNPKVTVFFLVLFTSIVSPQTTFSVQTLYGVWLVLYTMLWFVMVAWLFSRATILHWYQSHGHYIDWGMGAFLSFIALKLIITAF